MSSRDMVQELLKPAGIMLDGSNPWDPQIKNNRMFDRIFAEGAIAVGESYMDGDWDVVDMPEFFTRVLSKSADLTINMRKMFWPVVRAKLTNMQSKRRALQVVEEHYDLGNDLYEAFLDTSLAYTCGYWENATTLDAAQDAKHDLICKKLRFKPGMRVLDIGCGWGGFAVFAAKNYGVNVVGITISPEQIKYALALVEAMGLQHLVEIRFQDYRYIADGPYDRIVSIGMFEHVGYKNYRTYMQVARSVLAREGLFLLHTIAANETWAASDPWYHKYIFKNGYLPSVAQIGAAIDGIFLMKDWHTFGQYYAKTLLAWHEKFEQAWPRLEEKYGHLHGGRFYRMWKYYLLSMAGGFQANRVDLWQVVLSPQGLIGGYRSIR